jgi:AP-3 complex subunit beta
MSLMSINSFTRDLSDANQLVRGTALRVLASIRVKEIVQIQLMSLKKCAGDTSPYVRKTAAHSCGKVFQTDAEAAGELHDVIDQLLGDRNTQVLSSAFAAFAEVCPDKFDMLAPHYRRLCALLADFDDWGQITALGVLTRYARTAFAQPAAGAAPAAAEKAKAAKAKDFYGDDDDDESDDDESESDDDEDQPAAPPASKKAKTQAAAGGEAAAAAAYAGALAAFLREHGPTKLGALGAAVRRPASLPKLTTFLAGRADFRVDGEQKVSLVLP